MTDFWYNLSATNATDTLKFAQSTNNMLLEGWLGTFLLVALWIILFRSMVYFNNNAKLDVVYSSALIAMLSIPMRLIYLTNDQMVFVSWGMFAIALVIYFWTE
jgi:hypothetical protein